MFVPSVVAQRQIDEVTARCRRLAAQIAMLQAELVAATRELDALGGHLGGLTTAQHLSVECQLLPAEARRTVRLAQRLAATPAIDAAFAEGRLSEGTVSAMARVATPANEERLLEAARVANPGQLQRVVNTFRQLRPRDDHGAERAPDEQVSYGVRDDGMWHVSARLAPERGAQVEAAVRAAREMATSPDEPVVDDPEALVRVAQGFLAGLARGRGDRVLPERFLTIVHIGEDGEAHLQGGGALDRATAEQVWCESWASAVLRRRGVPVTATAPQRFAPPAMSTALLARDGGCRLCGATAYLHAHHVVPRAQAGATSLENLLLLCGAHHRRLHRHGWRITGNPNDPDDRVRIWRADGREIPTRSLRPLAGGAAAAAPPAPGAALDVLLRYLLEPPDAAAG